MSPGVIIIIIIIIVNADGQVQRLGLPKGHKVSLRPPRLEGHHGELLPGVNKINIMAMLVIIWLVNKFCSFPCRASFWNLIPQGNGSEVDRGSLLPCGGAETSENRRWGGGGGRGGGGGETNPASNGAAQEEELSHRHGLLCSAWRRLQSDQIKKCFPRIKSSQGGGSL